MADQQITDLPVATEVDDADLFLMRQGATDMQVAGSTVYERTLQKTENLNDVVNKATARTNLDVPQTSAVVLKTNNLSDLADTAAAINNLSPQLAALAANNSTPGLIVQTATNTVASRTLTSTDGITVTNPTGAAGNPQISPSHDLGAIEALSSNGIATRIGTNSWAVRTVMGTADQITVTNGDGVSANPTLSLPAQIILPSHSNAGSVTMKEASTNGTNTFAIEAPDNITSNFKWKIASSAVPTIKSLLKIDTSGNVNYVKPGEQYLGSLISAISFANTSIFDSSFDYYRLKIKFNELFCSTNNKKLLLQLYADGAYRTSSYLCSGTGLDANGTTYSVSTTSGAGFILCNNNASNESRIEMMDLMLTKDGSLFGLILLNNTGYYAPVSFGGFSGGGAITSLQGARIILDDGTITNLSGEVLVYGCYDVTM